MLNILSCCVLCVRAEAELLAAVRTRQDGILLGQDAASQRSIAFLRASRRGRLGRHRCHKNNKRQAHARFQMGTTDGEGR